jgi:hypothetical protein
MRWRRQPSKVQKEDIPPLSVVHQNIGMVARTTSTLTKGILYLSAPQQESTAMYGTEPSTPEFEVAGTLASATKKLYFHEASLDPTISFVKNASTKCQGTRGEETATKSQRNVRSQICTCLSENFIPG